MWHKELLEYIQEQIYSIGNLVEVTIRVVDSKRSERNEEHLKTKLIAATQEERYQK